MLYDYNTDINKEHIITFKNVWDVNINGYNSKSRKRGTVHQDTKFLTHNLWKAGMVQRVINF